jgi:hypothetical protein
MSDKNPRVPVSTGEGQTLYKRQLAYDQLGIDPENVPKARLVSAQLTRIARCVGYSRPLEILEQSEDPEARKVLAKYRSVARTYRKLLPVEAYCVAAGVDPERVLETITVIAVRATGRAAVVVASLMSPEVVARTAQIALRPEGHRERRMIFEFNRLLSDRYQASAD